jgi:uncharacterized protein
MIDGMLLPRPDDDSAPFFEFAAAGELRIQRCAACGRRRMPPQPMCPNCGSLDVEWERMSGRARVWSMVVAHLPLLGAYEAQSPYNVVVVELVDDPAIRLVGNVVTAADAPLDSVDPHSIEIGDEVEVVFAPARSDDEGDIVLPRWRQVE